MTKQNVLRMTGLAMLAIAVALSGLPDTAGAAELSKKKLQVFLLAGQSNMTGYCGIMPLTNLANYHELEDPALRELDKRLCKVVFLGEEAIRRNHEIRAEIYKLLVETQKLNEQLAQARKDKDEQAAKKLGDQIKGLGARKMELQSKLQVAKAKRVYMAPDGRYGHQPGVLAFGYGRGKGYLGPEYGFGLTLEQKLDAPILLIKVAQDGASLAYQYRPPSSGSYEQESAEYLQKLAKAKEELVKVWRPKAQKAIAAFWVEHDKFMATHLDGKRYAEWREEADRWSEACNSPRNGGPDSLKPWKVWVLERTAQRYFAGTDIKAPTMNYKETLWKERPALADAQGAGSDWRRSVEFTREVLGNLKAYHPEYDPAVGHDLAGFVWFQGWSDNNAKHGPHYARNLTNLINDLRRELRAPKMLVVSGTPSFERTRDKYEMNPVVRAQREVGQMPELRGNVAIVETLPFYDHPIWPLYTVWRQRFPEWSMVGSHVACHYLGSGRFFVRLGDGLSTAMVEMMKQQQ